MTSSELEILKTNSLSLENARQIGLQLEKDPTAGGVFPKAAEGNFSIVNEDAFKEKWCTWWKLAKIVLKIAKVFTGAKTDKLINSLLRVGNTIC